MTVPHILSNGVRDEVKRLVGVAGRFNGVKRLLGVTGRLDGVNRRLLGVTRRLDGVTGRLVLLGEGRFGVGEGAMNVTSM
eukprot:CAMPEP_0184674780 /NCGR_PEP_ID=MMETSP0308-20130426/87431_1 /TAXON_ID=38269 /ORGANISM="Gloeochaete witrockiana, Strain SAG 46.84" /LENGTH=79 /DNA_ID=CAMNT_0027122429 /DNA_START=145 /DNA_END=384 /DNA_ORIENTATION=-